MFKSASKNIYGGVLQTLIIWTGTRQALTHQPTNLPGQEGGTGQEVKILQRQQKSGALAVYKYGALVCADLK